MKRRAFLQLCGATAGAYAISGGARASSPPVHARRVLAIFVTGGWDTTFALDPKEPGHATVPAGAVRSFESLDIFADVSRPNITSYFERYAGASAIVRGIGTDAINHNECQRRIATGTREETRPDFAATIAHDLGTDLPLPYLVLGDTAWTGPYAACAGRVGSTNQIVDLLAPQGPRIKNAHGSTEAGLSDEEQVVLRAYAEASATRERATRGAAGYNRRRIDDFVESLQRSERIRAAREKFGVRGDALTYDAQLTLALDALQLDLSHAVTVSTRLPWDTHSFNRLQADYQEATFAGLTHVMDELSTRPGRAAGSKMIDDTTVVLFSEMSRTPFVIDPADPDTGKNHWPLTSALVTGAGVKPGIYGATSPDSGPITIDFATGAIDPAGTTLLYSHFVAGLLALCGVDPRAHLEAPAFDAFMA